MHNASFRPIVLLLPTLHNWSTENAVFSEGVDVVTSFQREENKRSDSCFCASRRLATHFALFVNNTLGGLRFDGFALGGINFGRLNRQRLAIRNLVLAPCSSAQTRFNGNCVACSTLSPACSACSVVNSKVTCTACIAPAVLRDGICAAPDECSSVTSNCTSCALSETPGGGVICKSCASGYGLRPDGRFCDACSQIDGCLSCLSRDGGAILCNLCEVARGLDLAGSTSSCPPCAAIITGCAECADGDGGSHVTTPPAPGSFRCTRCVSGSTLTNGGLVCE